MKILYDHQIFSSFAYSGISRYFCELYTEFDQMQMEWQVSCYFSNNRYLQHLRPFPPFFPNWQFRGKNRILESINLMRTRQLLARGDFDIFHATYSKPYSRALLKGKPYVITVHDLTHEKYLDLLPSGVRETAEEKESIRNADAIICPSYATRDDLVGFYPEAKDKITVIYHGFRAPPRLDAQPFQTLQPYFIHVGTRQLYRNFATAARAVAKLPREVKLLCVGGGPFTAAERQMFAECGMTDRVEHRSLSETELFAAYAGALGLIFPSEAEGFGLPVIEAQSQSCIPILSDIPCFREIGGDAALYFAVKDIDGCAAMLDKCYRSSAEIAPIKAKIAQNCTRFDWRQAAQSTLAVYRKLLAR